MTPECTYCHDLREIVRIDGTPEVCPVCREWPDEPADPEHHALRSEDLDTTRMER